MTVAGTVLDGTRVAVAQLRPTVGDVAANLALAERWVRRAASRGAQLVVFPECFVHGYTLRAAVLAQAEPADGPAVGRLRAIAAAHRVAIVAGFVEANPDRPDRPFNSAVAIDRDGRLAGIYRKTHLYGREVEGFSRGASYPVVELALQPGRAPLAVGMCICADIEYPEVARLLAIGGARLIAVPSADMEPFRAQQAANLACRAIENNLHVALANTVDARPGGTFFGGSGIAAPDGRIVSAGYGRPRLAVAELTDAAVELSGGAGAYLHDRRIDTYGAILAPAVP